ncbi:MAG: GNAT family N-acetyltransferase [Bacteroidota bacterium]
MYRIIKTDATHPDFIELVKALDAELAIRDGDEHDFYDQYNKIDQIKYALVAYEGDQAVGCGAIKAFDGETMEVKRMYVPPAKRGKGIASRLLQALEQWAATLGYKRCVLETGKKQPEAIALYKKSQYQVIPNYGQYVGIDNSVCFEKSLS